MTEVEAARLLILVSGLVLAFIAGYIVRAFLSPGR